MHFYQVDYCLLDGLAERGIFSCRLEASAPYGEGKGLCDSGRCEGRGQYVGTYMALTTLERYWYGEGEVKFYIDGDENTPTICGTGTEMRRQGMELCNAGKRPHSGKYLLHAVFGLSLPSHHDTFLHNDYHNDDQMPQRSFYRWHIQDPVIFEEDLKVTVQQIGVAYITEACLNVRTMWRR